MDLLSVIRRWHFRQEISIREIKWRPGLSRSTIRKYLRSDAVEPSFKVPVRPSKLEPFAEKLTAWLRVESKKPRKQKRTAKQLYADLVKLGYDGSYTLLASRSSGRPNSARSHPVMIFAAAPLLPIDAQFAPAVCKVQDDDRSSLLAEIVGIRTQEYLRFADECGTCPRYLRPSPLGAPPHPRPREVCFPTPRHR